MPAKKSAAEPVTVYAARIRYGEIQIFEGQAVLTEKTAKFKESSSALGYRRQVSRDEVYLTKREAMQSLVEQAQGKAELAEAARKLANENLAKALCLLREASK